MSCIICYHSWMWGWKPEFGDFLSWKISSGKERQRVPASRGWHPRTLPSILAVETKIEISAFFHFFLMNSFSGYGNLFMFCLVDRGYLNCVDSSTVLRGKEWSNYLNLAKHIKIFFFNLTKILSPSSNDLNNRWENCNATLVYCGS